MDSDFTIKVGEDPVWQPNFSSFVIRVRMREEVRQDVDVVQDLLLQKTALWHNEPPKLKEFERTAEAERSL